MVTYPSPILVVDVGGTKLAAAVMLDDNTLVERQEALTLAQEGAQAVLARLVKLGNSVRAAFRRQHPTTSPIAVGLASAGYIDHAAGSVTFATDNLPGWSGLALGERLTVAFDLPAFVENDAACFALAEATLGAGQGYRHLLVVAVGTGVGGGIVVDGKLYSGWQGRAGAIGHLCVEPHNGRRCTCGLSGCWESYTATRIMVAQSGFSSIQQLADHYQVGGAAPAVDEAARWLGCGLASLSHTLGPEAIVVGGSVGMLGERYLAVVCTSYRQHSMVLHQPIPILPGQLQADSGLLGAGIMARRALAAPVFLGNDRGGV
jgi:glucokinase